MGTPAGTRPQSVLVVDPCPDAAAATAAALAARGLTARVADDYTAALMKYVVWRPDAVVIDLGTPELDGWELARWVRACSAGRGPLIVAATGNGVEVDRARAAEAGIDLHLVKPVDAATVAAALGRLGGCRRPAP
jgi:two-component system CheB/CheR fusion protein